MHGVSGVVRQNRMEIIRPDCRDTDRLVASPGILTDISKKILWIDATAPCLAAEIGRARGEPCPVRTAERYLAGHRDWSSDAVSVIIAEILRRHMRRG